MNLQELKARAYDCLFKIETLQKELQQINQEILNYKEKENDTATQ